MNGRIDTLQSAILLSKLAVFDAEVAQRQIVAGRYFSGLRGLDGLVLPHILNHNQSVYAQFTVRVADRDGFRAKLQKLGCQLSALSVANLQATSVRGEWGRA